ncbi:DHS-like NAD/FAD-binding domain-containing protein [Nemania sp. FL0916]|nr:DHS-like NAD/FAD-binding domain-containing protein [Nemania sp. FL0916]
MPTLQVSPDALDLLQDVADTLAKARKMVIVTGAGISTNSGIPDFRSENGLYSLIQDQFERAEASANTNGSASDARSDTDAQKIPIRDHEAAAGAVPLATTTAVGENERPVKRRRTSGPDTIALPTSLPSSFSPPRTRSASRAETGLLSSLPAATAPVSGPRRQDPKQEQIVPPTPPDSGLRRVTRSHAIALRPTLPRRLTHHSADSSTSRDSVSVFSDQPPSRDSPPTDLSTPAVGTPSQPSFHSRIHSPIRTPRPSLAHLATSSSPLSSPPPGLFDPYENAHSSTENSSHDDSDCSDASESDGTQRPWDILSSQASSSNLRNMKGRDLFDCNIWADPLKTSVFYRFATSLRQRVKAVEPTITHRFIAQMRDVGKLARVYTQNIDEIEKKIGLSTDLKHGYGSKKRKSIKPQPPELPEKEESAASPEGITDATPAPPKSDDPTPAPTKPRPSLLPDKGVECVFLHGSLHSLRCFVCGKLSDWDQDGRETRTLSGEQPECPHCAGATAARQERGKRALGIGKLRPDIVLYGEEHPQSDLISPIVQHDLAAGPDLLLVLGTSLRVHGLKVMVKEFAKAVHKKGGKVIFINFTKPSESVWGDVLDYWIEWDCDAWVEDLKTRKPHLWLSPEERLELERQRRETLTEKKKEAERKRDSLGDKKPHQPEQVKKRPPPKNPVAMRNDYQCGAYVVWDIFQTLAKIGNRPFDNLGYAPSTTSVDSSPVPGPSSTPNAGTHSPDSRPQKRRKVERTKKKPPPNPSQDLHTLPGISGPSPVPGPLPNPDKPCTGGFVDTISRDVNPQQQQVQPLCTSKPVARRKRTRKPATASSAVACATSNQPDRKGQNTGENKNHGKHRSKDRYLRAARELAKPRRKPTPARSAILTQLPTTPVQRPSFSLESRDTDISSISGPKPSHPAGQADGGEMNETQSTPLYTTYTFQPRILPPLPDPPPYCSARHSQPTKSEFSQGPILPPLHVNWKESPPSRIAPMEIAPLVGPASPLGEKGLHPNAPHYSYTWHHSTQPIYSDSLVGISRQATIHKPQWQVETYDENTPSPSEQLRMEASGRV